MLSAYEWGLKHGSCEEGLEARKALGPDKTQADWWKVCDRGDWLLWQLKQLPDSVKNQVKPQLNVIVNKIANRAVKNHCLNCGIEKVELWAKRWLSGEDRSTAAAYAASADAAAAYAADAYAAAYAADAAAADAYAAAYAYAADAADAAYAADARKKEQKLQADDIRSEIPEWI